MAETNAVSMKLPQFLAVGAKIWFAQAESQFVLRNITAEITKYHHLLAALQNDVAITLTDFFEHVPDENPYTALKLRLLKKYTHTDLEKAEMIRSMPDIGDRKPSDLMDSMLALCPTGHTMSPLFLNEFLRRMPATVRGHLHTFAYEDPRALAQQADLVWSSHHSQTIHQISKDDINLSTEELACNTVNHPSKKKEYSERSRYENNNSSSTSRWCFYHKKYGKEARNCTNPCSYSSSSGNGRTGGRR